MGDVERFGAPFTSAGSPSGTPTKIGIGDVGTIGWMVCAVEICLCCGDLVWLSRPLLAHPGTPHRLDHLGGVLCTKVMEFLGGGDAYTWLGLAWLIDGSCGKKSVQRFCVTASPPFTSVSVVDESLTLVWMMVWNWLILRSCAALGVDST